MISPALVRRQFGRAVRKSDQRGTSDAHVSIVCNNCFGSQFYRYLGRPYLTPFVGLMVHGPCFEAILSDLDWAMHADLKFTSISRHDSSTRDYPIGVLGDRAELHFAHYDSEGKAADGWLRRRERLAAENILVVTDSNAPGVRPSTLALAQSYARSLILAPAPIPEHDVMVVRHYTVDAADLFREAVAEYDFLDWMGSGLGSVRRRLPVGRALRRYVRIDD